MVTDTIDTFTEKGVRTSSGEEIEADLIVAFTGFRLKVLGGIPFEVDGEPVDWNETVNFNPDYLMRDLDKPPQRVTKPEWRHNQDYWREKEEIPAIDLDGEEFVHDGERSSGSRRERAASAG